MLQWTHLVSQCVQAAPMASASVQFSGVPGASIIHSVSVNHGRVGSSPDAGVWTTTILPANDSRRSH